MGWLPQSEFDRLRREALALTADERKDLTWEEARRFIADDTLEMAVWTGLKTSGRTPWQAVAAVRRIPE